MEGCYKHCKKDVIKYYLLCSILFLFAFPLAGDGFIQWPSVDITVYEPGQKAIIGWNGEREVLILSTDVYASKSTWVVELVPFPSLPDNPIRGNYEAFELVEEIINRRGLSWEGGDVNMDGSINIVDALMVAQNYVGLIMLPHELIGDVNGSGVTDIIDALLIAQRYVALDTPSWNNDDYTEYVEILFAEQTGVHNITGMRAVDADALISAARELILEKVTTLDITWEELRNVASDYISRGMEYWVLDLLELGDREKSREPVIYTFDSESLFFPLKISSATSGDSVISLFTITENTPDTKKITGDWTHWIGQSGFTITMDEMITVAPEIAGLFSGDAILGYYQYSGPLSELDYDFIAQ
jgi:hypothetical protein